MRLLAVLLVPCALACGQSTRGPDGQRGGVVPVKRADKDKASPTTPAFNPDESLGLFVGINDFSLAFCHACREQQHEIQDLPFAVDDAVDLAFRFSLKLKLIKPARVILLLSGQPRKESSRRRLDELTRASATVVWNARKADILACLLHQAQHATNDGLFLLMVATHGIREDGVDYVLGADAIPGLLTETGLRTTTVLDLLGCQGGAGCGASPAARRLVLIDACREEIEEGSHGPEGDPRTAQSPDLVAAMSRFEGQATLLAARERGWSYDDKDRENGVFTAAVLDALRCDPCSDQNSVTVQTLADQVEASVQDWTKIHRPWIPDNQRGTQPIIDPPLKAMPLLLCPRQKAPESCRHLELAGLELRGRGGELRRLPLAGNAVSVQRQDFEALEELDGRPIFSGSQGPPACPWRWEELYGSGQWEELTQRPDGAFSIGLPPPGRVVRLRLMLCGRKPQDIELWIN